MDLPFTDNDLRALVNAHGGLIHGPRVEADGFNLVETVSIPENQFFELMREFYKSVTIIPWSNDGQGT